VVVIPGPLHRLTRLKDDPAALWLEPIDRVIVRVKGWAAWALYFAFLYAVRHSVGYVLSVLFINTEQLDLMFGGVASRIPLMVSGVVAAALFIPMRRAVINIRASTTKKMARQAAIDFAAAVDDFAELDGEPDGRLVSLVGWVRGHGYLERLVDGQRAVGFTLRCQDGVPFVLETMHNFDLLDEAGNEALVVTADGRLLGESNVRLSRASADDRQLVVMLDLPAAAVPTDWNAFVVRDGDPVMVVGTKTTVQDLTQLQHGRAVNRTAVASTKARPLLLFPLAAERREV
jgi:hypothetical protein